MHPIRPGVYPDWTGAARYWNWWRTPLTVAVLLVGVVVFLGGMAAGLSDPGPDGDTADFERVKFLGALTYFATPIVAGALLAAINAAYLSSQRRVRAAVQRMVRDGAAVARQREVR